MINHTRFSGKQRIYEKKKESGNYTTRPPTIATSIRNWEKKKKKKKKLLLEKERRKAKGPRKRRERNLPDRLSSIAAFLAILLSQHLPPSI